MKRVLGNLAWATASKLFDAAVRFLTVPIVLAHFGKLDFGLLALAYSISVFLAIADFGLNVNAVRRLSEYVLTGDTAGAGRLVRACSFYYAWIGGVNFVAVVGVGAMGASWFNLAPEQASDFFWMMVALGFSTLLYWCFAVHRQLIQAAGQLGWDERNNLICAFGLAALVWLTVHGGLDVVTYFVASLAIGSIPIALRVWKARRLIPGLSIGFQRDWALFSPMVSSSALIFVMSLAQLMAVHFRPIILASQGTLEAVGDYRILQGVVSFALMVSGGLFNVIYPEVARLESQGDKKRLRDLAYRGTSLLMWCHLLLLLPLMLASELILGLYVGSAYTHLALPLALWLLTCISGHNAILSSVLLSRGRLGPLTVTSVVNALLSLGLAWILVPDYGLNAVVWTYLLYFVVQTVVFYIYLMPPLGLGSVLEIAGVAIRPMLWSGVAAAAPMFVAIRYGAPMWAAGVVAGLGIVVAWLSVGHGWRDVKFLFMSGRHEVRIP